MFQNTNLLLIQSTKNPSFHLLRSHKWNGKHEGIKSRLNLGNACYHLIHNLLPSCLLLFTNINSNASSCSSSTVNLIPGCMQSWWRTSRSDFSTGPNHTSITYISLPTSRLASVTLYFCISTYKWSITRARGNPMLTPIWSWAPSIWSQNVSITCKWPTFAYANAFKNPPRNSFYIFRQLGNLLHF